MRTKRCTTPGTAAQARNAGADEMWASLILLFRTEPSDLLSRTSRLYPNRARQSQSNVRVAPPHGAPVGGAAYPGDVPAQARLPGRSACG
jgi:hypothetical protein